MRLAQALTLAPVAFLLSTVLVSCVVKNAVPPPMETNIPTMPYTASSQVPPAPTPTPVPVMSVSPPPAAGSGKACKAQSDCGKGETCQGGEGCTAQWTCQAAVACTDDLRFYCGCDGKTFNGSGTCAGQPYARKGRCEDKGPAAGKVCKGSADCAQGEMCTGPAGCTTPWTCQPARACTRDLRTYCGCDGKSFNASGSCPTAPYVLNGTCGGAKP